MFRYLIAYFCLRSRNFKPNTLSPKTGMNIHENFEKLFPVKPDASKRETPQKKPTNTNTAEDINKLIIELFMDYQMSESLKTLLISN